MLIIKIPAFCGTLVKGHLCLSASSKSNHTRDHLQTLINRGNDDAENPIVSNDVTGRLKRGASI
jgi:hypothetical protein